MRKQLDQMGKDLQELMIYQCTGVLGALWTEVNEMMLKIGKEQKNLVAIQMQRLRAAEARRLARNSELTKQAAAGVGILIVIFTFDTLMLLIAYDRQQKYPEYGYNIIPQRELKGNAYGSRNHKK